MGARKKTADADALPSDQVPEPAESFEVSLEKLEGIVESMQDGTLPLESLVEKYEEGLKLVAACSGKLENARQRIRKIEANAGGGLEDGKLDDSTPEECGRNKGTPDDDEVDNDDNGDQEASLFE